MIFKPIEPLDYPKLKHFFERQPYNLSIYSLLSIIVWSNCLFKTYYALDGDTLIISNESLYNPADRYLILPLSGSDSLHLNVFTILLSIWDIVITGLFPGIILKQ